jgi:dynein heavy chain
MLKEWSLNGLPHHDYYSDNAIIMYNSKRWPLMIDPHQQASKWLKAQMSSKKLKAIKTHEENFVRNL